MKANPHRETELYYDNVIIGSSVEALVAAYVHQIPIFGNYEYRPVPYYFVSSDLDLSGIHIENKKNIYTNLSGTQEYYGMQKIELWNILMHRLSIMGLAPMYGDYQLDLSGLPKITNEFVISSKGKIVNIRAKNVIPFDYPSFVNGEMMYMVNDHMKLKNAKNMKADILTEVIPTPKFMDTACYQTIVYKEGNSTNCCVKSIVSAKNLEDWNYTQTSIKLKVEATMFWNVDKKITVEVLSREISPVLKPLYTNIEEMIELEAFSSELE